MWVLVCSFVFVVCVGWCVLCCVWCVCWLVCVMLCLVCVLVSVCDVVLGLCWLCCVVLLLVFWCTWFLVGGGVLVRCFSLGCFMW